MGKIDGFFSQLPYECHLENGSIRGGCIQDLPSTRLQGGGGEIPETIVGIRMIITCLT